MLGALARGLFGTANDRIVKGLDKPVARINALEPEFAKLSDDALRGKTVEFRERLAKGETLDDLMNDAFATVREAAKRTLGQRPFDVQLKGGMVLHQGKIAEMKTGEGKTLVATLPCYLNALTGKGVHVVTVNDYLASRDAEWMGKIHRFLGLSVGCILRDMGNEERREAYGSDITYGTNSEMGFDYLRDNMKLRLEDYVQRGHNFAIVDEVDSILVDEARTPLIISGQAEGDVELYRMVDKLIPALQADIDYSVDLKAKSVHLTDEGVNHIEKKLKLKNLYEPANVELVHGLNQALRAHVLYRRDVEYMVREGKVVIIDEFTGRQMPGRRWSDGLHQAIEAKEKVEIEPENRTVATITYQNFFLLYSKLAGMTGTADTEAAEFQKIYKLDVAVIPTNIPVSRVDGADLVYKTEGEKFKAVVNELVELHKAGRPVLVGTVSVEKSEIISRMLTRLNIPHNVLNAKNHAREAEIIAQAGRSGAITIATNMAGRGTDILLGGNPDFQARAKVGPGVADDDPVFQEALAAAQAESLQDKTRVVTAGGLHIIGTERHDSRRIDNQLRGRAGRQGDPGSSRFYLSLEDNLLKAFGSDRITAIMDRFGYEEDVPIEHPLLNKAIQNAQSKLEGYHFGIRKALKEYDDVLNQQRQVFYKIRYQVLKGDEVRDMLAESLGALVGDAMDATCPEGKGATEWDYDGLKSNFEKLFLTACKVDKDKLPFAAKPREELANQLTQQAVKLYEEKEAELTPELMRRVEREVMLKTMDRLWMDHLSAIDHLRDSMRLRGIGQKDPLLEYKREGYHMFQEMMALRDEQVIEQLFRLKRMTNEDVLKLEAQRRLQMRLVEQGGGTAPHASPMPPEEMSPELANRARAEQAAARAVAQAAAARAARPEPAGPPTRPEKLPGRNDPCWCGSGKKYKKCHMAADYADLGIKEGSGESSSEG
ncbi:MAG: preprotein translocase subunit SecA [Myxococcota bacterium]